MLDSSLLHTLVVDPVHHSNTRTEFRFPMAELIHKETLELGNLAVVLSAASKYNTIGGANNLINRITLYLGNEVLDANYQPYSTALVSRLRTKNEDNLNLNLPTVRNGLALFDKISGKYYVTTDTAAGAITDSAATTASCTLNLNDLLPFFLGKWAHTDIPVMPLPMFKESLRLVIEWQTTVTRFANNDGSATITSVNQPVLIMDSINDERVRDMFDVQNLSYKYSRLEVENITSAQASGANASRVVRELVNAYNGKMLKRLCLSWNPTDATAVEAIGRTRAAAIQNERIQLILNGKNVLDYQGADNPAKKCAFFQSSWGNYIMPTTGHEPSIAVALRRVVVDNAKSASDIADATKAVGSPLLNNTSLFGVNIGTRCEKLQVDWSSSDVGAADAANPAYAAGALVFIGETENVMSVGGDGRVILSS